MTMWRRIDWSAVGLFLTVGTLFGVVFGMAIIGSPSPMTLFPGWARWVQLLDVMLVYVVGFVVGRVREGRRWVMPFVKPPQHEYKVTGTVSLSMTASSVERAREMAQEQWGMEVGMVLPA